MYILINQDNQIDSFSYNMRYLFKDPDFYLDKNINLSDLCEDLDEKLNANTRKKRDQSKIKIKKFAKKDSLELTDARTGTHPEKRLAKGNDNNGSLYDLGDSDEDEDMDGDELTRYVLKFRHSTNHNTVSKAFKVKIEENSFSITDYSYRILTLIPDDDTLNDWNDIDISEEEELERNKKDKLEEEEQLPSEESLKSLPGLVTERVNGTDKGTNMLRSQNSTFKFMKQNTSNSNSVLRNDQNSKVDETTDPTNAKFKSIH
jgi:hypothetical protein